MTFLPIVDRELRVAARRLGIYKTRTRIAACATLACAGCFAASQIAPTFPFGKTLFWGLAGFCMLYCLIAGRLMTADCLSREKRDGTLGLLFLTDLNGCDVVLGKLAATSLDGFYGMLSVFPMLAIPILVGGMTNGELWRMALVLVNTFLFSLAIGLFVSAVSRDEQKAMGANFGLWLLLAALLPAIDGMIAMSQPTPAWLRSNLCAELLYSCPVYTFFQCADAEYRADPARYWTSLGIILEISLVLIYLACRAAPHAWQDKPVTRRMLKKKGERRRRWWWDGKVEVAGAFRRKLLNVNAYLWLAGRPYLKYSYVWTAMFLLACSWASACFFIGKIDDDSNFAFAFILNVMLKLWVTTEAGHQLCEDKRSGGFELLLSTPLSANDIIHGQWLALRRQFLKPMLVAVAIELTAIASVHQLRPEDRAEARWMGLAGIIVLVADVVTIGWVAMATALTEKNHARATAKTTGLILSMPWILFGMIAGGTRLWVFLFFRDNWDPPWAYDVGWWFALSMMIDAICLVKARRQLHASFRQFALAAPSAKSRFARLRDLVKQSAEEKGAHGARFGVPAQRFAAVAVILFGAVWYATRAVHVDPPPPVVVSLSQSNGPTRVFPSQFGFLFIMPDGSLWRWCHPGWGESQVVSQPQPVGTNRNWAQVSEVRGIAVGVTTDGTLWEWNFTKGTSKQVGSEHDWVEAHAGGNFSLARKRDGTLWAWGDNSFDQLGNGPGMDHKEPAQVGTNRDWTAICPNTFGNLAMAVRSNGTLWTWGVFNYAIGGSWSHSTNVLPTQVCRETNWVGFSAGLGGGARNQAGEYWSFFPFSGIPDPDARVSSIGQLVSTNGTSAGFGLLKTTNWTTGIFETKVDGTLWATPFTWPLFTSPTKEPLRFGGRSDWVAVWGGTMTMIGMTSEGTLWTWGLDGGQAKHLDFSDRLDTIKKKLAELLGSPPPAGFGYNIDDEFQGYQPQKEPRALFRFVAPTSATGDR